MTDNSIADAFWKALPIESIANTWVKESYFSIPVTLGSMNETDLHLFLEMARNTDYYPLFYLALFTGMRRAELLALTWSNVDLLLCQLSVTRSMQFIDNKIIFKQRKTVKSRRLIALSPSSVAMLQEHLEAQNTRR